MHLTLAGGSLWHKQMSVCGNKRAPVEHVIIFFCLQGTIVSEVRVLCLLWNALGGVTIRVCTFWHQMTHTTYALCVWAKSMCALFSREWSAFIVSFFLWESSALVCPFSERIRAIICPPRLGSSLCWVSEETEIVGEIMKSWDKPYSARIHRYKHANHADIEGMREHGYVSISPIEGTLASYLLAGVTSTLKAPALPSKPLKDTSRLNGRAYVAVG